MKTRLLSAFLLVSGLGLLAGCFPNEFHVKGESTTAAENGRLRARVTQLEKDQAALGARLKASELENAGLRRAKDGRPLPTGITVPVASTIELDGISGLVNTDKDASLNAEMKGIVDTLRLYVMPYDQMHRLMPVAGVARVRMLAVGEDGKAGAVVAEKTWDAASFAKTWRDNITGIHFRLEVPLPKPVPDSILAQVEVEDWVTGTVLKTEKVFKVRRQK